MNLFINIFIIYFLPILIYTLGKNEYVENADEHLLSQRSVIEYSSTNTYNCSSISIFVELSHFSWNYYFYSIKGIVHKEQSNLFYLKTYTNAVVDEERIIREGKTTLTSPNAEFSLNIRSQGVYSIFLVAEDSATRCRSPIITIPVSEIASEEKHNPLHIWSPHLHILNTTCYMMCSISIPSDIYFLIEPESDTHDENSLKKSNKEIQTFGYYGGRFAEEAKFYVGDLSQSGRYHIWMVLSFNQQLSDVYFFEFSIPKCFLKDEISLLSSKEEDKRLLLLSLSVTSSTYPNTLIILSEPRDNHGFRPSIDNVVSRGNRHVVLSSKVHQLQYESSIEGNQILWMIITTQDDLCVSSLYRFVHTSSYSSDSKSISISSLLVTPIYRQSLLNTTQLDLYRITAVVTFPESISSSAVTMCELYYSFSHQTPTPITERAPISAIPLLGKLAFSFLLQVSAIDSIANPAILHVTAEFSLVIQSHRYVNRDAFHFCDGFILEMKEVYGEGEEEQMKIHGNVTEIAEVIQYESKGELENDIALLTVILEGKILLVEDHQFFLVHINRSVINTIYFIARRGNCVSTVIAVNAAIDSICSI